MAAPGNRSNGTGTPVNVSNCGFNWSSTTSDIYGLDLDFHSQHLSTSNTDSRAHGFQLRCLSE